jgi:hypothetical protein
MARAPRRRAGGDFPGTAAAYHEGRYGGGGVMIYWDVGAALCASTRPSLLAAVLVVRLIIA